MAVRTNAHDLPADLRAAIDALLRDGEPVGRLALARRHGKAAVERLEAGGHLVELVGGGLFASPLTVRELDAFAPWKDDETACLRALWGPAVPISAVAARLGRSGGDVLQKAWALRLDRQGDPDGFDGHVPAWRIRRLRQALAEAERRGLVAGDDGADLRHRALRRRFARGRALQEVAPNRQRHWSRGERSALAGLRDEGRSLKEIARILGRTVGGVTAQIVVMGIARHVHFSLDEDQVLVDGHLAGLTHRELAALLPGRPAGYLKQRLRKLGFVRHAAFRPWSAREREVLRAAVREGRVLAEVADFLGRGVGGVRWQCWVMNLVHPKRMSGPGGREFNAAEDARITLAWNRREKPKHVAVELGRSLSSVFNRAFKLGLTKGATSMSRPVTAAEVDLLRSMAGVAGPEAIAQAIGRTVMATQRLACKHGISLAIKRQRKAA